MPDKEEMHQNAKKMKQQQEQQQTILHVSYFERCNCFYTIRNCRSGQYMQFITEQLAFIWFTNLICDHFFFVFALKFCIKKKNNKVKSPYPESLFGILKHFLLFLGRRQYEYRNALLLECKCGQALYRWLLNKTSILISLKLITVLNLVQEKSTVHYTSKGIT